MIIPQVLSLIVFSATGFINAAVTMYGPLGTSGDYLECSSSQFSDQQLADLMAIENSAQATRNDISFYYDVDLTCGQDYATAVAASCTGFGADPVCHENQNRVAQSRIGKRTVQSSLVRRTAYYCKDASEICDDTIDANQLGNCPDGYTAQTFEVKGYQPGTFCTKPCTQQQLEECLVSVCTSRRKECAMYPGSRSMCGDALIKCRTMGPVSMDQNICDHYLVEDTALTGSSVPRCDNCVSYSNGQCHMNNSAFETYRAAYKALIGGIGDSLMVGVANIDFSTEDQSNGTVLE
jgi:hypothetical protein